MKKIISIIFVFCCFSSFSQKSSILKGNGKFEIFNAILYRNTPDLSSFGIKEFFLFYEDELLDKYTSGNRINKNKIAELKKSLFKVFIVVILSYCKKYNRYKIKKKPT